MENRHEFSIETQNNPSTNQPFGPKYAGKFIVRRATLRDEIEIRGAITGYYARHGIASEEKFLETSPILWVKMMLLTYLAQLTVQTPPWFADLDPYNSDDTEAVIVIWKEVQAGAKGTFRPDGDKSGGTAEA